MKDIPVFATENGVASLILKEIPYSSVAYVRIQSTQNPTGFIEECVSFCRVVGAECIYATGHSMLEEYPLHTIILEMSRSTSELPETKAELIEVTKETLEEWRRIYNDAMQEVANASYMTMQDAKKILNDRKGYYVYCDEVLIGIGMVTGNVIDAVASLIPGAGRDVVASLIRLVEGETVSLEVASTNRRALRLYQKLGFEQREQRSRWYKIF